MTAIRELLMRVEAMAGYYRNSQRFFLLGREARAELEALEAVAEAARKLTAPPRYATMGNAQYVNLGPLRTALARLAAVQDGQPSANTAIPTTAGIEPAAELACPCRVHGDPDGDCGERCA